MKANKRAAHFGDPRVHRLVAYLRRHGHPPLTPHQKRLVKAVFHACRRKHPLT